ncbi:hypothetical protein L1049_026978 [Liquidambar formosana]|uniref:Uncharacterized protein n=1 Tax=Liquidambar formosana TaxID=63359 RepID=A0AAP0NEQ5_LIQFO
MHKMKQMGVRPAYSVHGPHFGFLYFSWKCRIWLQCFNPQPECTKQHQVYLKFVISKMRRETMIFCCLKLATDVWSNFPVGSIRGELSCFLVLCLLHYLYQTVGAAF